MNETEATAAISDLLAEGSGSIVVSGLRRQFGSVLRTSLLATLTASSTGHHIRFVDCDVEALAWAETQVGCGITFENCSIGAVAAKRVLFQGPVEFLSCAFGGTRAVETDFFSRATFEGSTFARTFRAVDTVFHGSVSLCDVTYKDTVSFIGVQFAGSKFTDFRGLKIEDRAPEAESGWAKFKVDLRAGGSFGRAFFGRQVTFEGSNFGHDVRFDRAVLTGDAVFRGIHLAAGAELIFAAGRFGGSADFNNSVIDGKIAIGAQTVDGDLRFGHSSGSGSIFVDRARFTDRATITTGYVPTTLHNLVLPEPLTLTTQPAGEPSISGLVACTLLAPVTCTEFTALTKCSFAGTTGLSQLRFRADPQWATSGRFQAQRRRLADDVSGADDAQLEGLYRQLRAASESSGDNSSANDFYYGEMEARRRRTSWKSPYRWLLGTYRWLGGYGVRALRPFGVFLATVGVMGAIFHLRSDQLLSPNHPTSSIDVSSYWRGMSFALQNSSNLFRGVDQGLEPDGIALLVTGRFAAVSLLALTVVALRSHVRR